MTNRGSVNFHVEGGTLSDRLAEPLFGIIAANLTEYALNKEGTVGFHAGIPLELLDELMVLADSHGGADGLVEKRIGFAVAITSVAVIAYLDAFMPEFREQLATRFQLLEGFRLLEADGLEPMDNR